MHEEIDDAEVGASVGKETCSLSKKLQIKL